MKLIGRLLQLIIVIGIVAFLVLKFMPSHTTKASEPADFAMEAKALFQAFEFNETQASKQYIGKSIQVDGFVLEVDRDQNGSQTLLLSDRLDGDPLIFATLQADNTAQVGEKVTVKGQCTGMLFEVVLNKGVVLKD